MTLVLMVQVKVITSLIHSRTQLCVVLLKSCTWYTPLYVKTFEKWEGGAWVTSRCRKCFCQFAFCFNPWDYWITCMHFSFSPDFSVGQKFNAESYTHFFLVFWTCTFIQSMVHQLTRGDWGYVLLAADVQYTLAS